jgi:hypothetical protein
MLNLVLWSLVMSFSVSLFNLSFSYSGVARSFAGIGKGIAEDSVIAYDNMGAISKPYFELAVFKEKLQTYFVSSLKNYGASDSFSISLKGTGMWSPLEVGAIHFYQVSLHFECPVGTFFTYKNNAVFSIKKGATNVQ